MRALAALLLLFLALPVAAAEPALAQAGAIDDSQRDAIKDFFQKQQDAAAKQAQEKKTKDAQKKKADKKTAQKKDKKTDKKKDTKKEKKTDKKKAAKKADTKKKKPAPSKQAKAKDKSKTKNTTRAKETPKAQPALNLQPGGVLPANARRRALPKVLEDKLPKPAKGQQRVVVGNDVVLIEQKSGRIVDVVKDAAKGGP